MASHRGRGQHPGWSLALGAGTEHLHLLLVVFKLFVPLLRGAKDLLWGKSRETDALGRGCLGGSCPLCWGPMSCRSDPSLSAVPAPRPVLGRPDLGCSLGHLYHWAENRVSRPGLVLSWESEPRLKGTLGALEKQRRFLLHFS